MTNICQYCGKNIITEQGQIKSSPSILKEKEGYQCCNGCLFYIKLAQLLLMKPYSYMVTDGTVYEINSELDIQGKLVYIRFNDGELIKDYSNRIVQVGVIPELVRRYLRNNCTIKEKPNAKKMKLPSFIGVRKNANIK